ncbi:MAG: DNA polymerase III subunit beta [Planctomycetes bacterium]|nr:DNA polymerase III subunit beta [Planctomycetota bacterium]
MKFRCNRQALSDAFALVGSVAPQKSTIPILQNVRLEASDRQIEVVGTDLEVGVRVVVAPADVQDGGVMILPSARVGAILREGTESEVSCVGDGQLATLTCGEDTFKVQGANPVDYPEFPSFEKKKAVSVESKHLKDMIRKTIFATAAELTRYALTGVLFVVKEDQIRLVASDGKRLAYARAKLSKEERAKGEIKVIVPTKGMHLLERLITEEDESVLLAVEENQIKIQTKGGTMFSRLVEGSFPEYEAVIPSDAGIKLKLPVEDFAAAMRRAAILTSEKARATKFQLKKDKLVLLARTQDVGESKVEVPVKYDGDEFEIVFNPEYFTDVLRVVEVEEVQFELKDKKSPGVVRAGKDYVYLVMPLSIEV